MFLLLQTLSITVMVLFQNFTIKEIIVKDVMRIAIVSDCMTKNLFNTEKLISFMALS